MSAGDRFTEAFSSASGCVVGAVLFAIAAGVLAAIVHYVAEAPRRRSAAAAPSAACNRCGYLLIGLPDTRCPECGAAFTLGLTQIPDPAGFVLARVFCRTLTWLLCAFSVLPDLLTWRIAPDAALVWHGVYAVALALTAGANWFVENRALRVVCAAGAVGLAARVAMPGAAGLWVYGVLMLLGVIVGAYRVAGVDAGWLARKEWQQKVYALAPGVWRDAAGVACLARHEIPIRLLARRRQAGVTDAELCEEFPGVTPAELAAAWAYVATHAAEIEAEIEGRAAASGKAEIAAPGQNGQKAG